MRIVSPGRRDSSRVIIYIMYRVKKGCVVVKNLMKVLAVSGNVVPLQPQKRVLPPFRDGGVSDALP